jgi:hypothetical protein
MELLLTIMGKIPTAFKKIIQDRSMVILYLIIQKQNTNFVFIGGKISYKIYPKK